MYANYLLHVTNDGITVSRMHYFKDMTPLQRAKFIPYDTKQALELLCTKQSIPEAVRTVENALIAIRAQRPI
jgi:hypothetical protein